MPVVARLFAAATVLLALGNVVGVFTAALWLDVTPHIRLLAFMGHLAAAALFAAVAALVIHGRAG